MTGILASIRAVRPGPVAALAIGGAGLVVAICVGTLVTVTNFREQALDQSKRQLENSVLLLSRHFENYFRDFTAIQRQFVREIDPRSIERPEDFARTMGSAEVHAILKGKLSGSADVAGVNLWDADGKQINASSEFPVPARSIADRSYFSTIKSDPNSPSLMVELVNSRLANEWAIVFAQRIASATGEFRGLITRAISPRNIEAFLDSAGPDKNASFAFLHADGTLMARIPHVDGLIGRKITIENQPSRSATDHLTLQIVSPADGIERIVAVRRLHDLPLTITASTTVAAALQGWRQQTRFLVGVGTLGAIVIAVTLALIIRQLSRQHAASRRTLRLEKERFVTAVNNMTQGLLLFDAQGRLIMCNDRYREMFTVPQELTKPGSTLRDLLQHRKDTGTFSGDVDAYCANFIETLQWGEPGKMFAEAGPRLMELRYQPLLEGGWVTTMEDITERKHYEERIAHMAHYDSLTDLPNRALFRERLEEALGAMTAVEQLAVMYIDIDEFKSINDSLGHPVGDELLKSVAVRLSSCTAGGDFVARLGGDEFAVFKPGVRDRQEIVGLVAKIYDAVRQPYECLGHHLVTDASIGIAVASSTMRDIDQLVKNADLALYDAKSGGRRTYRFFEARMEERANARRTYELELRHAIANGELEIQYQPVVDLGTERIASCEALLRWRHPERGMISPATFIPVAEDTGLINEIGEWVLTSACAEAVTWPSHVRVAVNVSPVQFRNPGFALKVVSALASSGLAADRLELEVTETVLIHDDETTIAVLNDLRSLGVNIALDDFGTGYSSLSYLQRFPFDKIKIDRSFVQNVAQSEDSSAIVRAVIDIAGVRNITTTAEGVETEQQKAALRALGCAEMQGFLFSAAKSAAAIKAMFAEAARDTAAA